MFSYLQNKTTELKATWNQRKMSGPQPLNAVGEGTERMGMWESGEKLDVSERIKKVTKKYRPRDRIQIEERGKEPSNICLQDLNSYHFHSQSTASLQKRKPDPQYHSFPDDTRQDPSHGFRHSETSTSEQEMQNSSEHREPCDLFEGSSRGVQLLTHF